MVVQKTTESKADMKLNGSAFGSFVKDGDRTLDGPRHNTFIKKMAIMRIRGLRFVRLLIFLLVVSFLIYFLASSWIHKEYKRVPESNSVSNVQRLTTEEAALYEHDAEPEPSEYVEEQCAALKTSAADVDTVTTFPTLEMAPDWMSSRGFWDDIHEERYEKFRKSSERPKLKVFLVPHSHTDPGWLMTFEQYFEQKTRRILNNLVKKLQEHKNMTFIFSEVSFLHLWWETSHPVKQKVMRQLVKDGRLEITTGGWVMADEACTHLYALVDQLIEGHQWLKSKLQVSPRTGWSVDPFGHGPTMPHLLARAGLQGAVIQRIHYAWKSYLATRQREEFHWLPGWHAATPRSLLVHNMPFDIYSIKHSCGPHPSVCLAFDFRRMVHEWNEYTNSYEIITDSNVHKKASILLEEYRRIGSLTPHNVVLVPLGDDFRYEFAEEFDGQYLNYSKLFNYINYNQEIFNADVQFGTPLDYFKLIDERLKSIPTLKGDFFVYADVFSEGVPAYWSGYYTTRPFMKILARQFEHELRTAEILYTFTINRVKQTQSMYNRVVEKQLENLYEQLITARRNLGLFQHHDAITGTSRAHVMADYGQRMFSSMHECRRVQEACLSATMLPRTPLAIRALQGLVDWDAYELPDEMLLVSHAERNKILLFNSLIEPRTEVVVLRSSTPHVRVFNLYTKEYPLYQVNPSIEMKTRGSHILRHASFDIEFVATLPPLTAVTFILEEHFNFSNHGVLYCNNCTSDNNSIFTVKKLVPGDIQLENFNLKLLINRNTGFLRKVYRKNTKKNNVVDLSFGAYISAQRRSGAYLFRPASEETVDVLAQYRESGQSVVDNHILIVSGPVSTHITVVYLPFLIHTLTIYNVDDYALGRVVKMVNEIDLEAPPKNRDTEVFIRFQTDIENGDPPEFFSDQNGFQYQKRVKINKLGIEGNYYPMTTMAWIQDEESRFSVISAHAQGVSGFEAGRLEVMMDRRMLYDDQRGLGEGLVDNKRTFYRHWLLLEPRPTYTSTSLTSHKERHFNIQNKTEDLYQLPSQTADYLSRILNYPINIYTVDKDAQGDYLKSHHQLVQNFPSGLHLLTLRTMSDEELDQFPTNKCLMILQRPGQFCNKDLKTNTTSRFRRSSKFNNLKVEYIQSVSLTGLHSYANITRLDRIELEYMDIKTYMISFKHWY